MSSLAKASPHPSADAASEVSGVDSAGNGNPGLAPGAHVDIVVGIAARDQIRFQAHCEADGRIIEFKLTGSGCPNLLSKLEQVRAHMNQQLIFSKSADSSKPFTLVELVLPVGSDHTSILFREAFLRARGTWRPPYQEAEICHCRSVPTARVDQAIVCGSHTIQQIARETSAGTSCGTCRSDSESLIRYRLGGAV